MTLPVARPATLADLLAIPEDVRRHELIEGVIEEKGAATGEHGTAQQKVAAHIDPFDRRAGGDRPGGWWFGTDVDIWFDETNTFRPDVAGWRRDRVPERPRGSPVRVRPDWTCEILSTNRRNDLIKKKARLSPARRRSLLDTRPGRRDAHRPAVGRRRLRRDPRRRAPRDRARGAVRGDPAPCGGAVRR